MRLRAGLLAIAAIATIAILVLILYNRSFGGSEHSDFQTIAVDCVTGTGYIDDSGEPQCRT